MAKAKSVGFIVFFTAMLFWGLTPAFANAANLYFSPAAGSYAVGSAFSVDVLVSSADQAINAASGTVSFLQSEAEVVSVSKSGSIFPLWTQDPSFSNADGTVDFEGGMLNPGFTGTNGKIFTINFIAKTAGTLNLNFANSSVLANDGQATDILETSGTADFSLTNGAPQITPSPPNLSSLPNGLPEAPDIKSSTHPNQNAWYQINDADFNWDLPKDITAVRILCDRNPNTIPSDTYNPPIDRKEIDGIPDGTWYFHAQFKNNVGWGAVASFRFQIDTQNPSSFTIKEVPREDLTDPRATFIFSAVDKISGIDHYEVQIDNGQLEVWHDDGTDTYQTPAMDPGNHTLTVKAVNGAGNFLTASANFIIQAINPPIITQYTKEVQGGQSFSVSGSTYPNSTVTIKLQSGSNPPVSFVAPSDQNGKFNGTYHGYLDGGTYTMWAEVTDAGGAKSLPTVEMNILVKPQPIFAIGGSVLNAILSSLPIVAPLLLILLMVWFIWYDFLMQKRVKKEIDEVEQVLSMEFNSLRDSIQEQIGLLEKTKDARELTEGEEKILKELEQKLNIAQKLVGKEIEDVKVGIK